jgi:predicted metal-dependent peptidase
MENIHESIAKTSKTLMLREPFYGLFLMQLNKRITNDIPTAAVSRNGINYELIVNSKFWEELGENQRIGLMKHELLHIAFQHLLMYDDYPDKELLNIAMDVEINQYIDPQYYPTPDLLLPSTFPELHLPLKAGTREYYKLLQQAHQDGTCPLLSEMLSELKQEMGGKYGNIKHDWKQFGEGEGFGEAEKRLFEKQVEYQIKDIVDNQLKDRGTVPAELKSYVDKLYEIKEAVIDWKSYFRRFVGNSNKIYTKKTRKKINKRFEGNPALKIKTKKHVLVAIDTSGSVSDKEVAEFFGEIRHMHKSGVKLTIVECDADIHKIYEYKGNTPEFVHGRGGTNFQPVIDYLNANPKKYTSLVYLTDLECSVPSKACKPVLWVVSSRGKTNEEFYGQQVKIQSAS